MSSLTKFGCVGISAVVVMSSSAGVWVDAETSSSSSTSTSTTTFSATGTIHYDQDLKNISGEDHHEDINDTVRDLVLQGRRNRVHVKEDGMQTLNMDTDNDDSECHHHDYNPWSGYHSWDDDDCGNNHSNYLTFENNTINYLTSVKIGGSSNGVEIQGKVTTEQLQKIDFDCSGNHPGVILPDSYDDLDSHFRDNHFGGCGVYRTKSDFDDDCCAWWVWLMICGGIGAVILLFVVVICCILCCCSGNNGRARYNDSETRTIVTESNNQYSAPQTAAYGSSPQYVTYGTPQYVYVNNPAPHYGAPVYVSSQPAYSQETPKPQEQLGSPHSQSTVDSSAYYHQGLTPEVV